MVLAGVMVMGSTAFACVTFKGKMDLTGENGSTSVVGTGNSHGYCSTGRPTTAAAGTEGSAVSLTVSPGTCADAGALSSHQLDSGTYLVKFNNELSYNFDGTYWNMVSSTGCFLSDNSATTSDLGSFTVDTAGNGSWSGALSPINGTRFYAGPTTASNFCIGRSELVNNKRPGMLAPFQLLLV